MEFINNSNDNDDGFLSLLVILETEALKMTHNWEEIKWASYGNKEWLQYTAVITHKEISNENINYPLN